MTYSNLSSPYFSSAFSHLLNLLCQLASGREHKRLRLTELQTSVYCVYSVLRQRLENMFLDRFHSCHSPSCRVPGGRRWRTSPSYQYPTAPGQSRRDPAEQYFIFIGSVSSSSKFPFPTRKYRPTDAPLHVLLSPHILVTSQYYAFHSLRFRRLSP